MNTHSTYSFTDTMVTVKHPKFGQISLKGEGLGNITVTMTTDRTAHDVAADGHIMVSKIAGNNGTLAMNVQQTSDAGKRLIRLFNYLMTAPSSEWARTVVTIKNDVNGDNITATGVAPQKQADKQFQAAGQQITWNMLAANITQE